MDNFLLQFADRPALRAKRANFRVPNSKDPESRIPKGFQECMHYYRYRWRSIYYQSRSLVRTYLGIRATVFEILFPSFGIIAPICCHSWILPHKYNTRYRSDVISDTQY